METYLVKSLPDGVRRNIYEYIRHPVAALFDFVKKKYYMKYSILFKSSLWYEMAPSVMGTNYYGSKAIIRTRLKYGEMIRYFKKKIPCSLSKRLFIENKYDIIDRDEMIIKYGTS